MDPRKEPPVAPLERARAGREAAAQDAALRLERDQGPGLRRGDRPEHFQAARQQLGLGIVHPLVRDAVYDELPPGERELKHTRAAELLNEDPGAGPDEVATHLLQMPRNGQEWVVRTLRNAARSAVSKGAADSATAYLRRALEEPPDAAVANQTLLELGIVESLTDAPAAIPRLREALGGIKDPLAKGLTANLLARVQLFAGDPEGAAEMAERVAEDLPIELEDISLSLYAFVAASTAFGVDRPDALERLKAFRNPKRIHQLGEKMMAAAAAYDWAHRNGPRDEVIALANAALEGGDVIEADNGLLPMYAVNPFADRRTSIP